MNSIVKISALFICFSVNQFNFNNVKLSSLGDPVPGIDVSLEQIPGGIIVNTKTDEFGNYSFENVKVGNYKIHFGKIIDKSTETVQARVIGHEAAHVVQQKEGREAKKTTKVIKNEVSIKEEGVKRIGNQELVLLSKNYNSSRSNVSQLIDSNTNKPIPLISTELLEPLDFNKDNVLVEFKLLKHAQIIKGNLSKS